MKKKLSLILVLMLVLKSGFSMADDISPWAFQSLEESRELDMLPKSLDGKFKRAITRKEFSEMSVKCAEAVFGKDKIQIAADLKLDISYNPFTDTDDENIIFAYSFGIVNGRGNGIFDPNSEINRQEAAKMLSSLSKKFKVYKKEAKKTFQDSAKISNWAKDSINFTFHSGIMRGISDGEFSPLSKYTIEQAIVTFQRLRNYSKISLVKNGEWNGKNLEIEEQFDSKSKNKKAEKEKKASSKKNTKKQAPAKASPPPRATSSPSSSPSSAPSSSFGEKRKEERIFVDRPSQEFTMRNDNKKDNKASETENQKEEQKENPKEETKPKENEKNQNQENIVLSKEEMYELDYKRPNVSTRAAIDFALKDIEQKLLNNINKKRADLNLAPLRINFELNELARQRVGEIVKYFSHNRPDGSTAAEYIYSYDFFEEDSNKGVKDPDLFINYLTNSDHKSNALSEKAEEIGISFLELDNSESNFYWTILYYKKDKNDNSNKSILIRPDFKDHNRKLYSELSDEEFLNVNRHRILALTNQERQSKNLPKLKYRIDIQDYVDLRAREISEKWSHDRPDGTKFNSGLASYNFSYAGENIAAGYQGAEKVVEGWINSRGHYENLMHPKFSHLTVGIYRDKKTKHIRHFVQIFTRE